MQDPIPQDSEAAAYLAAGVDSFHDPIITQSLYRIIRRFLTDPIIE